MSVVHTALDYVHDFLQVVRMLLGTVFEKSGATVLPNLELGLAICIQKVENSLVVNLDVRALNFELYLSNLFRIKYVLVVQRFARTLGLRGFSKALSVGMLAFNFLNFMKKVLKGPRKQPF